MAERDFTIIRTNGPLPDPKTITTDGIVEEIWSAYIDTVVPLLSELEVASMALESGANPQEDKASIRRILHSIKGDSGMAGLMDFYHLCHETETAFEEIQDDKQAADIILKVKDWIYDAIQHIVNGETVEKTNDRQDTQTQETKLKALVIEDDEVCRERLKMLLGEHFHCTFGEDGLKGFELYKRSLVEQEPFDLVTLDINMPRMNGHETLEAIRRLESRYNIEGLGGVKVIMITSEDGNNHIFSSFRQGCEAYVVKSDMGDKLLDQLAKLGLLKVVNVHKDYAVE